MLFFTSPVTWWVVLVQAGAGSDCARPTRPTPSPVFSEAASVVSIARIERPQLYREGSASLETMPAASLIQSSLSSTPNLASTCHTALSGDVPRPAIRSTFPICQGDILRGIRSDDRITPTRRRRRFRPRNTAILPASYRRSRTEAPGNCCSKITPHGSELFQFFFCIRIRSPFCRACPPSPF